MKSTAIRIVCILVGVLFIFGYFDMMHPRNASSVDWKYSFSHKVGSIQDVYAVNLGKLLKEKSNGEINLVIYRLGELGTIADVHELLMTGGIQLATTTVGHIGNYVKEIQVFNVPYLFPAGSDIYYKVVNQRDSVFYKFFDNEYNKRNLKLLGMYEEGIQAWSSRKPLRKPDDLKGLKIRVMPSPLIAEAYRILGANPTPIPFGEVYSALQLGMVDAQENPINTIWDMKFFEVQDYITSGYSYHLASGTGANLKWHNGLPEKHKQILAESIDKSIDHVAKYLEKFDEDCLNKIKKAKPKIEYYRLSSEEVEAFRAASQPVRAKFVEMTGEGGKLVMESLLQEISKAQKR